MDQKKKQDIALMRYSAIAPVVSGLGEEYPSYDAFYRDAEAKGVTAPDGSVRHFAAATVERWLRDYRKGGFDALLPECRSDVGVPRKLDTELQDSIRHMKEQYPHMPVTVLYRQLIADGTIKNGQVSLSTVGRFIKLLEYEEEFSVARDMRRYERPHINEVWCGDSCVGPYITTSDKKKHRVYVIALIDDASRMITGIDIFFNDNFVNLMSVMKGAVSRFGRPKVWNFDNGASYKNKQMELLAARTGSVVHYCHPYSPTEKSKIERWFRTLREQWLSTLDMRDFHSLDELRGSLMAYVQNYNQRPHSSLRGQSPSDRFFSEPEQIVRLKPEKIEHDFLLEIERRVSADSVITIDQVEYEVDCRFSKRRIALRYSPDMENIYVVEADGTLTPIRLLDKHANANVKREKVQMCTGKETTDDN